MTVRRPISHDLLIASTKAFLASPRGQIIATTKVGAVIGSRSKKLKDVNWYELTGVIPDLSKTDCSKILTFLGDTSPAGPAVDDLEPIRRGEAEGKLGEAFSVLKRTPPKTFSTTILKDFLPSGGPSLPFEELLTFKQLSELGVENIIRKRGMSSEKISALAESVFSFLESSGNLLNAGNSPLQPSTDSGTSLRLRFPSERNLDLYPFGIVILDGFLQGLSVGFPQTFLLGLSSVITQEELLSILIPSDGSSDSDRPTFLNDEMRRAAYSKIDALLQARYHAIRENVRTVLQSAGLPRSALQNIILADARHSAADALLIEIIIRAVGGRHPIYFGRPLKHLFTLSPDLGEMITKSLKDSSNAVQQIHQALPHFPLEDLVKGLKK